MHDILSPQSRIQKIRRFVYIFIIVAGLFDIICPYIVHADIFMNDTQDVYVTITENVKETNDILSKAFQFCQVSPYTIINNASYMVSGGVAVAVHRACQTLGLILATLLLMVDFFRKSANFEWSSKWENILLFLVKIIVVKVVVTNVDNIVGYIYTAFNSVNTAATGAHPQFLPYGTATNYTISIKNSLFNKMWNQGFFEGWWDYWEARGAGESRRNFTYTISQDAVKIFYPYATFPLDPTEQLLFESHPFGNPKTTIQFNATVEIILLQVYFIIMKAISYIIFVIAIGRIFELCIYILFAPLPLATFASETTSDVAKSFIKNFCATVIQVAVIVVMFVVYVAVTRYVTTVFPTTPILTVVTLIALGLGVVKSGTWAKKVCGIG